MKQMSLIEMDGFLKGKCIPRDLKVNETNAEYLVRKFGELESKLETALRECRSAGITIDNLEAKCAALAADNKKAMEAMRQADAAVKLAHEKFSALAAENDGMSAFVDVLLSIAWQGCSADGAEIQDLALKHGLLRQDVYSADEHENQVDDPGNFEEGDPVYFRVETPVTDAFLSEVRAHGVEMFAASLKVVGGGEHPYSAVANEFAAQLRKGGNQ
ncbi:TPA: hNH endonuclease [Escherichia coli]|nr:hNH endonuclease [Escherichia coli]HDX4346020.1 hNH endonuclease [Escherichia coli]